MAYFKIGNNDYSNCVNKLAITRTANYSAQTNASGNTVADYINEKRKIDVGIIPLDATTAKTLLEDIKQFNVKISFLNPYTNELEEQVNCIIPTNAIEYYTIQAGNIRLKEFSLSFTEL